MKKLYFEPEFELTKLSFEPILEMSDEGGINTDGGGEEAPEPVG